MVFFPKTHNLILIMQKTSEKLKLKDILQNTRTALFIIVKVMKNTKENEETASDQRILRSYDN